MGSPMPEPEPTQPTSDDLMIQFGELGQCYHCYALESVSNMALIPIDEPGNLHYVCEACDEHL